MARRTPKPGSSRQHKHSGGSFSSERQRKFLWAVAPKAARKWAHNKTTRKIDWSGVRRSIRARRRGR